jgi:hypothetical protein
MHTEEKLVACAWRGLLPLGPTYLLLVGLAYQVAY